VLPVIEQAHLFDADSGQRLNEETAGGDSTGCDFNRNDEQDHHRCRRAYQRTRGGSFHSLASPSLADWVADNFSCLNNAREARSKSKERFTIRVLIR